MAFFEELGRKAKDVAAVAADKAKDVAAVAADKARETTEKTKISVAIAGEQREIEKNCRLIGEWFINEYEGELPEGVQELADAVAASKARIAELEDILLHVVIIDESEGAPNAVSIGCTVTVVDLKTGREMPPYKVVGSQEADPMHRAISEESPFGKALMGAKEGDEISVEAPVGIIHYRVEKIER